MGLKYASVRQPYAVVMAPALTESSQPQGLSLKSGAVSSPVPLLTLNENAKSNYEIKCSKQTGLKTFNRPVGMNGDTEHNKDLITIPFNSCDEGEQNKTCISKNSELHDQGIPNESDYSLLQIGGFMMNNSYSGTGDDDNMGLHKSVSQVPNVDSYNYFKMDLFKNLGTGSLPQNDLGGGGDLGHNVEEIMQVIKNMESKGNDIEENIGLHINDGHDIEGSLSTFEREFLNDVDMMNICVDENLGDNNLAIVNKDTLIKEKIDETQDRQFKIERKCAWLLRRLRKMQTRAMGKKASEVITGMLQHVNDLVVNDISSNKSLSLYSAMVAGKGDNERTKDGNSLVLSTLVRRLDYSRQQQALACSQNRLTCRYFGSGSLEASSSRQCYTPLPGSILPKFSSDVRKDVESVSGQLYFQLKVVENGIDSDVTASSSGGESCDEMQNYNNPQPQSLPISKRAAWKWLHDRAAIASRWSWLQAQIVELEYRLKQNSNTNQKLRTIKGSVVLGGNEPPRLCDSVVVNGYHGSLPGTAGKTADEEIVPDSVSRTRPLLRSSFRKRKLLHTAGLHLISKKAAKSTTVQCGCHLPLTSCTLCTGRPNPTLPRQDMDLLTVNERIALLDPAFHPVLSLPCDISQCQLFDGLMKTCNWQMKSQRLQLKTSNVLRVLDQPFTEKNVPVESKTLHHRRRYFKRTPGSSFSEKLKMKLAKGRRTNMLEKHNNYALERFKPRRRFSSLKAPGLQTDDRGLESRHAEEDLESKSSFTVVSGVSRPSPVPSPSLGAHSSKEREASRRKRENSYDIDNIVIPYSVAASTRLEKLQYKEILTPMWRVLPVEPIAKVEEHNNGLIKRNSHEDEDIEDMSDEVLNERHERAKLLEKKRFEDCMHLKNPSGRLRGIRRADSRAESSGGNTPDPMSPAGVDGGVSPMISPPATPQPIDAECATRRRTISSRCVSPVDADLDEVPPYEPRTFPLTDETYEKMLRVMPPGHPFKACSSTHPSSRDSECESRPVTPLSDSTESADTLVDEDPNDPEWTVNESPLERVPFKR